VKVKAVVTEVLIFDADKAPDELQPHEVDAFRAGASVERKVKYSQYKTKEEILAENRKSMTPRKVESNRKNANKPPKPGKMARGRPRKVKDE